ncbi:hypothetical protein LRAMOSA09867 [Lichtheimia ramosa]|uniref:Uncharacterized protein n=1 Tax=Lichtheimia ramosa TaxID=688394 RepID=A0A077WLF8_9FUNG|nr:hypothetical protein LRAMOSA09867 [Lichtheimia ramosa]
MVQQKKPTVAIIGGGYPNCACDVPSHLYSLSTEINPDWSKLYSGRDEIYAYQVGIAKKHNLYAQTRLETRVTNATWLDDERQWLLDLEDCSSENKPLESVKFDIIFVSVGSIRVPRVPEEFKGFTGPILHTAQWDSSVDFTGKRVAIIGSGASAVQTIPALADQAKQVYNYQRTPIWCKRRNQFAYSSFIKFIFRYVPLAARLYRFLIFLRMESNFLIFGYYKSFLARLVRKRLEGEMRNRILKSGRPDLVDKLIPKYPPGCKRIVVTDDYLETLCKSNVVVETSPIESVKGNTITTKDGNQEEFDILCLATGFDVQGFLGHLQIKGKDKQTLNEAWYDKFPDTYKTVNVHGYPNAFILLGPSSLLGHNSVLIMAECQINYAIQTLRSMIKNKIAAFEPKQEAQQTYVAGLKSDLDKTVWKGNCSSWYVNKEGDVTAVWSSTVTRFWWLLRKFPGFHKDYITYKAKEN